MSIGEPQSGHTKTAYTDSADDLITGFRRDYLQQRTNLREFMCRSVLATQFILTDRYTSYLLPPCVQDYLPEDHMARFVVELVDQLDLRSLSMQP
ncbi:MAG: hypothetical protein NTX38_14590 [Methylobacter sp.]|nr:hypothetical protein [Methylobacter sp.]